jgi:hypothetical protein
MSTVGVTAGERMATGIVAGVDTPAGAEQKAAPLPPPPLPQFSGASGDFSLSRQPGVGALHRDDKGYLEPGFYLDAMSNRRTTPVPRERARLGEDEAVRTWDVGAVVGYQLRDGADPRTGGGINLQVVTGAGDFESGMLLQPGVDYTVPFSDSLQLSARIFGTYQPQTSNRTATANPEATTPALRGTDPDGGWRDVGVNLGIGYNVSERWTLETQAGFTQSLGERTKPAGGKDEQQPRGEIFGGVFLNYRF